MAARPRTIGDQELLDAVAVAVGRVGPARLTLADVAREAGVSTGTLVQRFGSKRELLLAFARSWATVPPPMRAAYDTAPDPLEGLRRAFVSDVAPMMSPEEFANHLAFLHLDLSDPEFHALLVKAEAAERVEFERYVTAARDQGLLAVDDIPALVGVLRALLHGTRIRWAIDRDGTLTDSMLRDLDAALAPYLHRSDRDAPGEEGER